jgi:hypothetical protein
MNKIKSITFSQRVTVSVILILFVSLPFWPKAYSDTGNYVVPVQVIKKDSTIQLGFLPLFVNKIIGIDVETNMKTRISIQGEGVSPIDTFITPVTKGRLHTESYRIERIDTLQTLTISWDFGEIEILGVTDKGLRIKINVDDLSLELKEVTHFISGRIKTFYLATHVWTSPTDFFYRDESMHIPIKQVKKIRTIGEVLFIPANWGD